MLASLPRLTSLTLNDNDSLGASGEALAPLSLLTSLQVLGCVLVCMLAKLFGRFRCSRSRCRFRNRRRHSPVP